MAKAKKPKKKTWTTKDGTSIPVEEMTDLHIASTIAMLERWIVAHEKAGVDYEDYEDGVTNRNGVASRFKAKIGMLKKEQLRRTGLTKRVAVIADMIRIELEGPHIGARIV
jgi:hypothetical protein